jgi:hypothetical protein
MLSCKHSLLGCANWCTGHLVQFRPEAFALRLGITAAPTCCTSCLLLGLVTILAVIASGICVF